MSSAKSPQDDLPKAAIHTLDVTKLPWGTLRAAAQHFLFAWNDLQGASSASQNELGQLQMQVSVALATLALTCERLGLLAHKSCDTSKTATAILACGNGYNMMLAVNLAEAAGAMWDQVKERPRKTKGYKVSNGGVALSLEEISAIESHKANKGILPRGVEEVVFETYSVDDVTFDAKLIETVRKSAERLPAVPLAEKPIVRDHSGKLSIPPRHSIEIRIQKARHTKSGGGPEESPAPAATIVQPVVDGTPVPTAQPFSAEELQAVIVAVGDENTIAIINIAQDESRTADEKLNAIAAIDCRFLGYKSPKWAKLLKVTPAAIRQTEWWRTKRKELIEKEN